MSHNPMGLHGQLQEWLYRPYFYFTVVNSHNWVNNPTKIMNSLKIQVTLHLLSLPFLH
jgi:hypothetical protein